MPPVNKLYLVAVLVVQVVPLAMVPYLVAILLVHPLQNLVVVKHKVVIPNLLSKITRYVPEPDVIMLAMKGRPVVAVVV